MDTATTELEVGTILCTQEGYSIVSPRFYKVMRRTPKTAVVCELADNETPDDGHGFTGTKVPCSDTIGDEFRCKITDNGRVHIHGHYSAVWDGRPKSYDYLD